MVHAIPHTQNSLSGALSESRGSTQVLFLCDIFVTEITNRPLISYSLYCANKLSAIYFIHAD